MRPLSVVNVPLCVVLLFALLVAALPAHAQAGTGWTLQDEKVKFNLRYSVDIADPWQVPISGDLMGSVATDLSDPYLGLGLSVPPLAVVDALGWGQGLNPMFRALANTVNVGVFVIGTDFDDWKGGGLYWRFRLLEASF